MCKSQMIASQAITEGEPTVLDLNMPLDLKTIERLRDMLFSLHSKVAALSEELNAAEPPGM